MVVFSRKYGSLWFFGFELTWRSAYQLELLKIRRVPVLYRKSGDGDGVGFQVAAVDSGEVVKEPEKKVVPAVKEELFLG